jgi:hypothetical protein
MRAGEYSRVDGHYVDPTPGLAESCRNPSEWARAQVQLKTETGKNLGVRWRYPPVLNDARYTGPVAR